MKSILRRLPFAMLTLLLVGALTASGGLFVRRAQVAAGEGAVASPGIPAAYGDTPQVPAAFETELTYTSLDAPENGEAVARVSWDDAWFVQAEAAYNPSLAHTASVLAALAYSESGYYQAGNDSPPYMEQALTRLGFTGVSTESYRYRSEVVDEVLSLVTNDADGVAYTIARKPLQVGEGARRDLILVSVRGSYGSEWISNLDLSRNEEDDHGGYVRAAQEIGREVGSWATESRAEGAEVSVLLVGHSRGGAVANLVAAQVDDERAEGAGSPDGQGLAHADAVYAYTFASPFTTLSAKARSARYGNIFNIANPSDIMPALPLSAWGYARYGIDIALPRAGAADFDEFHEQMLASYQSSVGVACGADPSDAETVDAVVEELGRSIASVEDLVTPAGAMAVLTSVASRVDPVRILYSHYPSTYIAWMDVLADSECGSARP